MSPLDVFHGSTKHY